MSAMTFLEAKLGQSLGSMFFSCPKGLSQWLWSHWKSPFWADRARLSLEHGLWGITVWVQMAPWLVCDEHIDKSLTQWLKTYELAAEGGAWRVGRVAAAESICCFPGFPLFLQCLDTDFVSWALIVPTLAQITFAASEEREKCENRQFWNQVREKLWQLQLGLLSDFKQEEGAWEPCQKTEAILFPVIYDLEAVPFVTVVLPAPAWLFPVSTALHWTHTWGSKWM